MVADLCFFTMANVKMLAWARRLVSSGDAVDRPIWYYRIPPDHPDPKRYKLELLMGDMLPPAEKYVYLDADTLMVRHGEWESEECMGATPELFDRGYEYCFADKGGFYAFCELRERYGYPQRVNTGCVVLPAIMRKTVGEKWLKWCERVDKLCEKPTPVRDQMHFAFVRQEFNLPFLPPRYNVIIKQVDVPDDAILLHAAGKPHGDRVKPYHEAVESLLGGFLEPKTNKLGDYRWQMITRLILLYAENPTYPVGAEVGVDVGETAGHLLGTFPGLELYCIDNWSRGEKRYNAWRKVYERYADRVVEFRSPSDVPVLDELLDFVFIDADHSTEQVILDINHWWPQLKLGGVMVGHDIDHESKSGGIGSVRAAVASVFDKFKTGPDKTWWVRKE